MLVITNNKRNLTACVFLCQRMRRSAVLHRTLRPLWPRRMTSTPPAVSRPLLPTATPSPHKPSVPWTNWPVSSTRVRTSLCSVGRTNRRSTGPRTGTSGHRASGWPTSVSLSCRCSATRTPRERLRASANIRVATRTPTIQTPTTM